MKEKYKLARLVDCDGDISKEWYIVFYVWDQDTGKLVRKRDYTINSAKTKKERKEEAKELIKKINAFLESGSYASKADSLLERISDESASDMTLIRSIEYFLEVNKTSIRKNSKSSFNTLIFHLKEFLPRFARLNLKITEVTTSIVHKYFDYLKSQELSNRSYNNHRGSFTRIFNFYIDRKEIKENPVESIRLLKTTAKKHKPYTDEQMKVIKKDLILQEQDQFLFFIQCIYYTFLRPGQELRLLKVEDIKEKTIQCPGSTSKNHTGEHVIIPKALEKIIEEKKIRLYPSDYYVFSLKGCPGPIPIGTKNFYKKNAALLDRLGMTKKGYDLYGYKHTGVIKLYNATKDIQAVQRQCRHSTIQQTVNYMRELGLITNEVALNFPEF